MSVITTQLFKDLKKAINTPLSEKAQRLFNSSLHQLDTQAITTYLNPNGFINVPLGKDANQFSHYIHLYQFSGMGEDDPFPDSHNPVFITQTLAGQLNHIFYRWRKTSLGVWRLFTVKPEQTLPKGYKPFDRFTLLPSGTKTFSNLYNHYYLAGINAVHTVKALEPTITYMVEAPANQAGQLCIKKFTRSPTNPAFLAKPNNTLSPSDLASTTIAALRTLHSISVKQRDLKTAKAIKPLLKCPVQLSKY